LDNILQNPYYAGVFKDPWSGVTYDGKHQPMVTKDEFARIQVLLKRRSPEPRQRIRPEFPLRGLVRCPSCERPFTASFARGKCRTYAYYHCSRRGCPTRTRNYPRETVHAEFVGFLADASIPTTLAEPIVDQVLIESDQRSQDANLRRQRHVDEIRRLERQLQELIAMRSQALVTNSEFCRQRDLIREDISAAEANTESVATLTEQEAADLVDGLSNLHEVWTSAPLVERRGLNQLLLPIGYVFQRIRTAEKGLLLTTFGRSAGRNPYVVPLIKTDSNTLIKEIKRFLALIRCDSGSSSVAA
jgi:hypothetical protein